MKREFNQKIFLTLALFLVPNIIIYSGLNEILPEYQIASPNNFNKICLFFSLFSFFISCIFLSNSSINDGISLRVIYWFYSYLFLGLSIIISFLTNSWKLKPLNNDVIIYALALIIFCNLLFEFGYRLIRKKNIKCRHNIKYKYYEINYKLYLLLSIIVLLITALLIFIYNYQLTGSVIRIIFGAQYSSTEQIFEWIYRSMPAILIIFLYYLNKLNKYLLFFLFFISILNLILITNPISSTRVMIFSLYFSILITFFYDVKKFKLFFLLTLIFGIFASHLQQVIQFFFLNDNSKIIDISLFNYFLAGHFDSFEQIIHTLDYVISNQSTYGRQLLGAIFFFIPREVWVDKPIGSGDFIYYEYIKNYADEFFAPNISSPLLAETFINFSYFFSPFIFFALGVLAAILDYKFKKNRSYLLNIASNKRKNYISFTLIFYPFLVSIFLFILRGDLQSGFSFLSALFINSYILFQFLKKKTH